jgi:hypothetical protein
MPLARVVYMGNVCPSNSRCLQEVLSGRSPGASREGDGPLQPHSCHVESWWQREAEFGGKLYTAWQNEINSLSHSDLTGGPVYDVGHTATRY